MPTRRLALGAALIAATVLLVVAGARAQDKIAPLKVHVGESAPNFTLTAADGTAIRLSDYRGRNVLIDFYRGYW